MKTKLLFILFAFFLIISCESNSSLVEIEKNKLFTKVVVSVQPSFYDPISKIFINEENINFEGELISESITTIESIKIGNESIPFTDSYSIDRKNYGVIKFNKPSETFIDFSISNKFLISTKIGGLEGFIQFPDSIYNISYNLTDIITASDSLIILFEGNADYYVLNYWISYAIPSDTLELYYSPGEIISKTNKFVLSSSHLNKSGRLAINSIESFNGPYLEEGSKGNMTGDGTGFLYSKRNQSIYNYFDIVK